jgi:hypothetical protein
MARTYKKNAQNVFKIPMYAVLWFWLLIAFLFAVVLTLLLFALFNTTILLVSLVAWLVVVILIIVKACSVVKRMIKAGTIETYFIETSSEKAVTKSLLATMSVNRLQDTPYISVPSVTVCDSRPSHISVEVEKLAGMYDIDKMIEDINSSFRKKLSDYAVTSALITENGLMYKFILEDKGSDKTWRPATLNEMKQKSHVIKLQENLSVNLADSPHLIVWGKSGSGKSTAILAMILQLFLQGAETYFIDPKLEYSAFKNFYPSDMIAEDTEAILELLRRVCDKLKDRQRKVSKGVRERQKMGLRAYDLDMKPVVVVADEIGSAVAMMDSKQKKEFLGLLTQIVQKGRSVSVFAIVGTQSPKVETTLSSDIRQQFATKILLGSASGDVQRMAFDGEVATKGNTERFKGFYISDGKTNEQPLSFAVTDLHAHGLNSLENFQRAYEIGSKAFQS